MKRIFQLFVFCFSLCALCASVANAQTSPVLFTVQSLTGQSANYPITLLPDQTGATPLWYGTNLIPTTPIALQPIGGQVIANLVPWGYTITMSGWPRGLHVQIPLTALTNNVTSYISTNQYSPLNIIYQQFTNVSGINFTVSNLPPDVPSYFTNYGFAAGYWQYGIGLSSGTNFATEQVFSNSVLSSTEFTLTNINPWYATGSNFIGQFPQLYDYNFVLPNTTVGIALGTNLPETIYCSVDNGASWQALSNSPAAIFTNVLVSISGAASTNFAGALTLYGIDHPEYYLRTNSFVGQSVQFADPINPLDAVNLESMQQYVANQIGSGFTYYVDSSNQTHYRFAPSSQLNLDMVLGSLAWSRITAFFPSGTNWIVQCTNLIPNFILQSSTNLAYTYGWQNVAQYSLTTNSGIYTFSVPKVEVSTNYGFFRIVSFASASASFSAPLYVNDGIYGNGSGLTNLPIPSGILTNGGDASFASITSTNLAFGGWNITAPGNGSLDFTNPASGNDLDLRQDASLVWLSAGANVAGGSISLGGLLATNYSFAGYNAYAGSSLGYDIALGFQAAARGGESTALGPFAQALSLNSIAVGSGVDVTTNASYSAIFGDAIGGSFVESSPRTTDLIGGSIRLITTNTVSVNGALVLASNAPPFAPAGAGCSLFCNGTNLYIVISNGTITTTNKISMTGGYP